MEPKANIKETGSRKLIIIYSSILMSSIQIYQDLLLNLRIKSQNDRRYSMCSTLEVHVPCTDTPHWYHTNWKASRLDTVPTAIFPLKSPQKLAIILSLYF